MVELFFRPVLFTNRFSFIVILFYMILSALLQINYQTVQTNRDKRRNDKVGQRFLAS